MACAHRSMATRVSGYRWHVKPEIWISIYAAILASPALALNIKIWLDAGIRLKLTVIPDGVVTGGDPQLGGKESETSIVASLLVSVGSRLRGEFPKPERPLCRQKRSIGDVRLIARDERFAIHASPRSKTVNWPSLRYLSLSRVILSRWRRHGVLS